MVTTVGQHTHHTVVIKREGPLSARMRSFVFYGNTTQSRLLLTLFSPGTVKAEQPQKQ